MGVVSVAPDEMGPAETERVAFGAAAGPLPHLEIRRFVTAITLKYGSL